MPIEAMWLALEKLAVPGEMVWLICCIYEGMKAEIHGVCLIEKFDVRNGIRQGCCYRASSTSTCSLAL